MADIKLTSDAVQLDDALPFIELIGGNLTRLWDESPAFLTIYRLPDLWLPSGRVTACDGFIMERGQFARPVIAGRYPVLLGIERFRSKDELTEDQRVAFAMIRFADRPAAEWQMAVLEGQDVATLKEGYIFGYPVDSGTGCFCDPAAQKLINEATDPEMMLRLGPQLSDGCGRPACDLKQRLNQDTWSVSANGTLKWAGTTGSESQS